MVLQMMPKFANERTHRPTGIVTLRKFTGPNSLSSSSVSLLEKQIRFFFILFSLMKKFKLGRR